jgi:hypothetical protein
MKSALQLLLLFATLVIMTSSGLGVWTWQYWAVALCHIAAVIEAAKDGDNDGY